jgi:hypothetical protein
MRVAVVIHNETEYEMSRPKFLLVAAAIVAASTVLPVTTANAAPAKPAAPAHAGYSGACHAAVDTYWPAAWRGWAHQIVHRESRGIATAANPRSSARGCFQMLLRYSSPFYRAVGCSNAMWSNATCNVRAALVMRTKHGTWPWKMPTRRR